jgi:CubicO group peptidase (beta-lactamase class C family)
MVFRKQLLRGDVHDPGAAMMGGVAGHAGLFSNANDLAKFMQMYLNGGTYGGRTFLSDTVISRFSTRAFTTNGNRRALGFDKPEANGKTGPACPSAPPESYGHTGFTGTMVWIDPVNDLLYIFLSNRIHPNQFNNLLIEKDIRTRIQQVIYDAIIP